MFLINSYNFFKIKNNFLFLLLILILSNFYLYSSIDFVSPKEQEQIDSAMKNYQDLFQDREMVRKLIKSAFHSADHTFIQCLEGQRSEQEEFENRKESTVKIYGNCSCKDFFKNIFFKEINLKFAEEYRKKLDHKEEISDQKIKKFLIIIWENDQDLKNITTLYDELFSDELALTPIVDLNYEQVSQFSDKYLTDFCGGDRKKSFLDFYYILNPILKNYILSDCFSDLLLNEDFIVSKWRNFFKSKSEYVVKRIEELYYDFFCDYLERFRKYYGVDVTRKYTFPGKELAKVVEKLIEGKIIKVSDRITDLTDDKINTIHKYIISYFEQRLRNFKVNPEDIKSKVKVEIIKKIDPYIKYYTVNPSYFSMENNEAEEYVDELRERRSKISDILKNEKFDEIIRNGWKEEFKKQEKIIINSCIILLSAQEIPCLENFLKEIISEEKFLKSIEEIRYNKEQFRFLYTGDTIPFLTEWKKLLIKRKMVEEIYKKYMSKTERNVYFALKKDNLIRVYEYEYLNLFSEKIKKIFKHSENEQSFFESIRLKLRKMINVDYLGEPQDWRDFNYIVKKLKLFIIIFWDNLELK